MIQIGYDALATAPTGQLTNPRLLRTLRVHRSSFVLALLAPYGSSSSGEPNHYRTCRVRSSSAIVPRSLTLLCRVSRTRALWSTVSTLRNSSVKNEPFVPPSGRVEDLLTLLIADAVVHQAHAADARPVLPGSGRRLGRRSPKLSSARATSTAGPKAPHTSELHPSIIRENHSLCSSQLSFSVPLWSCGGHSNKSAPAYRTG